MGVRVIREEDQDCPFSRAQSGEFQGVLDAGPGHGKDLLNASQGGLETGMSRPALTEPEARRWKASTRTKGGIIFFSPTIVPGTGGKVKRHFRRWDRPRFSPCPPPPPCPPSSSIGKSEVGHRNRASATRRIFRSARTGKASRSSRISGTPPNGRPATGALFGASFFRLLLRLRRRLARRPPLRPLRRPPGAVPVARLAPGAPHGAGGNARFPDMAAAQTAEFFVHGSGIIPDSSSVVKGHRIRAGAIRGAR